MTSRGGVEEGGAQAAAEAGGGGEEEEGTAGQLRWGVSAREVTLLLSSRVSITPRTV